MHPDEDMVGSFISVRKGTFLQFFLYIFFTDVMSILPFQNSNGINVVLVKTCLRRCTLFSAALHPFVFCCTEDRYLNLVSKVANKI